MRTALLISTYNWVSALNLVLKSVQNQVRLPDEILIADDGSNKETKELIEFYKKQFSIPVQHVWHEDAGFRKSKILNKTIAASTSDYIIQIDGDCIIHPYFIKDHIEIREKQVFLYGSRVNIHKKGLEMVMRKELSRFSFFSSLIKKRTRNIHLPYLRNKYAAKSGFSKKVRGCNISYWRKDFLAVNGYNEEIEGWGREDSELIIRMLNSGVKGKRLKYGGILYHIYHKEKSRDHVSANSKIQQKTIEDKRTWCENGVDQYFEK
ncbi:glycosyltransferase family 2 protein [Christiangramia forsetii]|uniref:Glycosyl transferase, family 2 n=2 Tax=Christiangramia forsetii TaxID=411153 RepID=A0M3P9_CHRFK|nr:glycosyltransferase family 2 protein [Christiangramia forsetii]GGG25278.1 glycosyl transferase family 2 [Christiangramia forsetii]CAL67244.1 glycosyl transferase, family 2 [Christiangramia forsetii KT0803]